MIGYYSFALQRVFVPLALGRFLMLLMDALRNRINSC